MRSTPDIEHFGADTFDTGDVPTPARIEQLKRARYVVEVRGLSLHAEADELAHIGALLNGHAGRVHVIDRQNRSLLFEGSADDVRRALAIVTARSADEA